MICLKNLQVIKDKVGVFMKKLLSFALCFVVLLSLGSCDFFKEEEEVVIPTTSQRSTVVSKEKVSSLAKEGKVEGAHFALGADMQEVKDYFFDIVRPWTVTATSSVIEKDGTTKVVMGESPYDNTQIVTAIGEHEDMYKYQKGNSLTSIYYNGEQYFYVNGNESAGAAILVCNIEAYGFKMGNCLPEDVINSLGDPDYEDVPDISQLFFCLGSPVNPSRLTYNYDDKRLDFVFSDGNLLVVTLTDTDVYNGFYYCEPTSESAGN